MEKKRFLFLLQISHRHAFHVCLIPLETVDECVNKLSSVDFCRWGGEEAKRGWGEVVGREMKNYRKSSHCLRPWNQNGVVFFLSPPPLFVRVCIYSRREQQQQSRSAQFDANTITASSTPGVGDISISPLIHSTTFLNFPSFILFFLVRPALISQLLLSCINSRGFPHSLKQWTDVGGRCHLLFPLPYSFFFSCSNVSVGWMRWLPRPGIFFRGIPIDNQISDCKEGRKRIVYFMQ